MSTMVRVDDATHRKLQKMKRADESFDDVISRLLESREREIDEGAGFWGEGQAEEARRARARMKRDVGVD